MRPVPLVDEVTLFPPVKLLIISWLMYSSELITAERDLSVKLHEKLYFPDMATIVFHDLDVNLNLQIESRSKYEQIFIHIYSMIAWWKFKVF